MNASVTRSPRFGPAVRVLLVFTAITLWWLLIVSGISTLAGADYTRNLHVIRAIAATAFAVPLVVLAARYLDKKPVLDMLAIRRSNGARAFVFGALCWLVPALVSGAAVLAVGWAQLEISASAFDIVTGIVLLVVLVLLYEAVSEELLFRGYFYAVLNERHAAWVAATIQTLLFVGWGLLTGAATTIDRIVLFFAFAGVLGAIRAVTGNLLACMGFHAAFQVTAQLLTGGSWDLIVADDPDFALQAIAFVAVPFLCTAIVLWVVKRRPTR